MRILPAETPQTINSLCQSRETPRGTLKENLSRPHPRPLGTVPCCEPNRKRSHQASQQLSPTCGLSEGPADVRTPGPVPTMGLGSRKHSTGHTLHWPAWGTVGCPVILWGMKTPVLIYHSLIHVPSGPGSSTPHSGRVPSTQEPHTATLLSQSYKAGGTAFLVISSR